MTGTALPELRAHARIWKMAAISGNFNTRSVAPLANGVSFLVEPDSA